MAPVAEGHMHTESAHRGGEGGWMTQAYAPSSLPVWGWGGGPLAHPLLFHSAPVFIFQCREAAFGMLRQAPAGLSRPCLQQWVVLVTRDLRAGLYGMGTGMVPMAPHVLLQEACE